ncbi:DUF1611 domain-containing protein [Leptolyngbyaceae cyanobacterium CCMR0082]|uniref:DUF1611 domain-containing protein n=1 Tax=Adonisia turfae CCMR0082 TaxID=2304604 RepID=A0A6M0S3D1_9CYAN|nr:DUF1611 domain-containing protein [Adonisia turfae]MDV3351835.1 DUF1611 domain-containing protein [Leptothoe sp. LEGE 181152]NEZ62918.1 DUF1611 domain-containing protein [Adonisia turfae CCMR0082]
MHLQPHHRIAILLHNGITGAKGKTGLALLRYSQNPIAVVVDETCADQSIQELTGINRDVPIVATMAAALHYQPDVLAIGLAPSGGRLPEPWLEDVRVAIAAGLNVMNGLHTYFNDDPTLTKYLDRTRYPDQWIWDMRQEIPGLSVGSGKARDLNHCRRVLAVGTDMAVGKMSTCIELDRATQAKGLRSQLIATGQTALMLGAPGIALDAVRVDFAAGAVEQAVLDHSAQNDVLYVEGQGSLLNPASTATLPLLRGTQPTHLVLVHKINLERIQHFPDFTIPPMQEVINLYETVAHAGGTYRAPRMVGIALNTFGVSEDEARNAISNLSETTGLPCTDVVRFSPSPILDVILNT